MIDVPIYWTVYDFNAPYPYTLKSSKYIVRRGCYPFRYWCSINIISNWHMADLNSTISFKNKDDMVLFKLRWDGEIITQTMINDARNGLQQIF